MSLRIHGEGALDAALKWTIERRRDCAEATRAQHQHHRRWLVEWFGDVPVMEVTFARVLEYIDGERARGIKTVTIKHRLVTLRMALEDCYRRGLLPHTIDWWPEIVSDSTPGEDLWTYDQWRAGRLAFAPPQRIGLDVLWWTGMHASDVRRWRRGDVDLVGKRWRRYNTKSHAKPELLPLPDELARILDDWFASAAILADAELVAPGWWISPRKLLDSVAARAELPRITQNGLRRSCVSYQFELGAAKGMDARLVLEWVAHWLGHRGDPMTSDIIRRHYLRWTQRAVAVANPHGA